MINLQKGSPTVLLFGSAVSGVAPPYLPMLGAVNGFEEALFSSVVENCSPMDEVLRVTSTYARLLSNPNGEFRGLLNQTKFEELLEQLENEVGPERLDELMNGLFYCTKDQYGFNQRSIAVLLEHGLLEGCLTTNFDNALEQACGPNLDVRTHSDSWDNLRSPYLLKLHGCVVRGDYINTNRSMVEALYANTHQRLRELLRDKTLLVMGYSGGGDIDVRPHLLETPRQVAWFSLTPGSSPRQPKVQEVITDLSQSDDSNWLFHVLKQHVGEHRPALNAYATHNWRENLSTWVSHTPARQWPNIVAGVFVGKNEIAKINIELVKKWSGVAPAMNRWEEAIALTSAGLYGLALRKMRVSKIPTLGWEQLSWYAFTLWRLGRFKKALNILSLVINSGRFSTELETIEARSSRVEPFRLYLEVAYEYLSRMGAKGQKLYNELRIDEIIARENNIVHVSPRNLYLARLAIARISFIQHRDAEKASKELSAIFETLLDLKLFGEAASAALALTEIDPLKGMAAVSDSLEYCGREQNKTAAARCKALMIASKFVKLLPKHHKIAYRIIEGPFRRRLQTPFFQTRYRTRVFRWRLSKQIHDWQNH